MDELKPCLIDRNKIPFKELWKEARFFADAIVCTVDTDFMQKIAEAEHRFIRDLLNRLQQMEVIDVEPVVRCKDCTHRYSDSWCEYADDDDNFYCARGERKDGAD